MRSDWVQRGAVSLDRVYPWADFFLRPPDDSSSSAFHPTESGTGWLQRGQQQAVLDNQPVAQSLVVALPVIMVHEFPDGLPQGSFSEQDKCEVARNVELHISG